VVCSGGYVTVSSFCFHRVWVSVVAVVVVVVVV
jgi:hypothetical protein